LIDNHLYWGNALGIDVRSITWRRVVDLNDRVLRRVAVGLGDGANGDVRETGFDITVASEVMAILCLASDPADLEARLARIVVAKRKDGSLVTAGDLEAAGAMAVLLKDAAQPNLVQTIEGSVALIHGGPFANIAHGCNSVIATKAALKMADYVVTEAGFGADLGAEKFLNIKCRSAGLAPSAAVIVATVRALKMQGGVGKADLGRENLAALRAGLVNLGRHVENMALFGVPIVVAINAFDSDTAAEHGLITEMCQREFGVEAVLCRHWALGASGAEELAQKVVTLCAANQTPASRFNVLYPDDLPLEEKIRTVARSIYRAADVAFAPKAEKELKRIAAAGFGHLPVCMAKTPYSFTADETVLGAPTGHFLPVREVRLSAGAGFVVAICGEVMTMPGLPKVPAANAIHLDASGNIEGLF
jgi:formate--tetrahydrofolate ligase